MREPPQQQYGAGVASPRVRATFDDAWWAMATLDAKGRVLEANDAFAEVAGRPLGDLVGVSLLDVFDRDAIAAELDVAARLVGGHEAVVSYPRQFEQADGSIWEGTAVVSLVRDQHGEPALFHVRLTKGYSRRPPERIAWKEGDFELALDEMRVGVAIIGLDGTALKVNSAMCELAGRSEAELRSIDLLSITHPDDREADIRLGTQAWSGEIDGYLIEKRLVRPDGSVIWVRQELTFARGDEGNLLHIVGQVIDITGQKAVEEELARSRQEMVDLINRLPIGLVTADRHGRVTRSNPAAAAIVGLDDLPVGFDVGALVHPEDRGLLGALAQAHAAAGTDYHAEFRIERPDGTMRWIRTDTHPDTDTDGTLVGLSGTWLDITELNAAEQALRFQATHDHLTALPNRRLGFDRLNRAVQRCERGEGDLWVLFVDLDGFKLVNDAHGHVAGDQVLAQVGRRFRAVAEELGDAIARLGGDEFLVVCERPVHPGRTNSENLTEAPSLAERLIRVVEEPFEAAGEPMHIGASIGISRWRPGLSADDLVGAADHAVYEAKRAGRGRWHLA